MYLIPFLISPITSECSKHEIFFPTVVPHLLTIPFSFSFQSEQRDPWAFSFPGEEIMDIKWFHKHFSMFLHFHTLRFVILFLLYLTLVKLTMFFLHGILILLYELDKAGWQDELVQQCISSSLLTCRFLCGKQDTKMVRVKYLDFGTSEIISGLDCPFLTCLAKVYPLYS